MLQHSRCTGTPQHVHKTDVCVHVLMSLFSWCSFSQIFVGSSWPLMAGILMSLWSCILSSCQHSRSCLGTYFSVVEVTSHDKILYLFKDKETASKSVRTRLVSVRSRKVFLDSPLSLKQVMADLKMTHSRMYREFSPATLCHLSLQANTYDMTQQTPHHLYRWHTLVSPADVPAIITWDICSLWCTTNITFTSPFSW